MSARSGRGPLGVSPSSANTPATSSADTTIVTNISAVIRSANGVPLCASTQWLPAARAPDAAKIYEATHSITRVLAAFGIRDYRRHSTRVTAGIADAIEAARLDLAPGRPLLVVESIDVTPADGKPIATSTARFAADRVELMVEN